MVKVIESVRISCESDGEKYEINILWYNADEEGYGVELIGDTATIDDFSFGDSKIESYAISLAWFEFLSNIIEQHREYPEEIDKIGGLTLKNGRCTDKDVEKVFDILELIKRKNKDPLAEKRIEELRKTFGWKKEDPPLWKQKLDQIYKLMHTM